MAPNALNESMTQAHLSTALQSHSLLAKFYRKLNLLEVPGKEAY